MRKGAVAPGSGIDYDGRTERGNGEDRSGAGENSDREKCGPWAER